MWLYRVATVWFQQKKNGGYFHAKTDAILKYKSLPFILMLTVTQLWLGLAQGSVRISVGILL